VSAAPTAICLGACYLAAGFGVLGLVGALRSDTRPLAVAALTGMAYMCGLAATSVVLIALLCIGLPMTVPMLVIVSALLAAGGCRRWLRSAPANEPKPGRSSPLRRAETSVATVGLAGLAFYALVGFRWAANLPLAASYDAWAMWVRKGQLLNYFGSMPTQFFTLAPYAGTHPDYPLMVPLMNALWFRVGGFNPVTVHAQYWVLLIMGAWAMGWLASRFTRPIVWVPLTAALLVCAAVLVQLISLEADIPLGLFLMLSVMALGSWLQSNAEQRANNHTLAIAVLCLGAAANIKDEGLTDGVVCLVIVWVLTLVPLLIAGQRRGLWRHRQVRLLLIATAAFAAMAAPWLLWLAAHHLGGSDVPIGKGLNPIYVFGRLGRAWPAIKSLYGNAVWGGWLHILPIGLVITAVGLIVPKTRRIAGFYLLTGVGVFLSLVWVYAIATTPLTWYLDTSANRTVDDFMFVAIAGIIHLAGVMVGDGRQRLSQRVPRQRGHSLQGPPATVESGAGTSGGLVTPAVDDR
jgi:hypothetical protein